MSVEINQDHYCERKECRLNETLKQQGYQIQMMLNWVEGAVINVDREGNVIQVSDVALRHLGWSEEEFLGRNMHETIQHTLSDGGEYPWEFSPVFAAIEDGSSHHVDGDVFWHRDGSSFQVDYIVTPSRDEFNQVTGSIIIFRNLTAQKLQEAKRIHSIKLESLGELSAGIAHEINTPVQFIGSNMVFLQDCFNDLWQLMEAFTKLTDRLKEQNVFADEVDEIDELLEEADLDYLKDEIPNALQQTLDGVERVSTLVQGLKGFAHSNPNDKKEHVDLNFIIKNAITVCQNSYKYVAELNTELGDLPMVPVYSGDIGQVLVNLLVNASHAIEDVNKENGGRGEITIRSRVENDMAVISVTDTGGGIPEQLRERIFDPFFTTKEVGRGSGQGLAISRNIIHDRHSGELTFESIPGKGTEFFIRLPLA